MISKIDLRGTQPDTATLRKVLPRGGVDIDSILPTVRPIVEDVRARGAVAALHYGAQFDATTPESVRVPQEVMEQALEELDPQVRRSLDKAIEQVRSFHSAIKPEEKTIQVIPGGRVSQRWIPVERVGLYVPGGRAVYPSSVIMNVVPAQEAGVESLVVASPPQSEFHSWPHPTILAACVLLGVTEVWAVGGAQAIALLAYGDNQYIDPFSGESAPLEPVDLITGPGNIFVTAAKRLCRSVVGIDAEAGPTEIAILADDTADPVAVAYDLISQAEHDPMAASVLITASEEFAQRVDEEVEKRYQLTLNHDRVREALTGEQSGIILVTDRDMGIQVANAYAAEHLEVQTAQAEEDAAAIRHAGAIFIGHYSPVPLGDYAAGSNHVLPTSGSARYASGLSTHTFLKSVHVINYDKEALESISDTVISLADAEQLPAHGEAIKARTDSPGA